MIQYTAIPSPWKFLFPDRIQEEPVIMTVRELVGDKKRIADNLDKFRSDQSTDIEFDLLHNPFEFMKAFFRTEFLKEECEFYFLSNNSSSMEG